MALPAQRCFPLNAKESVDDKVRYRNLPVIIEEDTGIRTMQGKEVNIA